MTDEIIPDVDLETPAPTTAVPELIVDRPTASIRDALTEAKRAEITTLADGMSVQLRLTQDLRELREEQEALLSQISASAETLIQHSATMAEHVRLTEEARRTRTSETLDDASEPRDERSTRVGLRKWL